MQKDHPKKGQRLYFPRYGIVTYHSQDIAFESQKLCEYPKTKVKLVTIQVLKEILEALTVIMAKSQFF